MVEIKSVDKESIPAIATLLRKHWKERNLIYTQSWAEQYVEIGHKLELKRDQTFILKEKEKIIGVIAVLLWEGNVAELRDFVVKKEQRGKGFGKKLLEYAIDWSKRNNVRKIFALSLPINKPLFEQFGFKLEGFLKNHFKTGEDLLFMSLFPEKKPDKQIDLKEKLDNMRQIEDVERETAARLRGLGT